VNGREHLHLPASGIQALLRTAHHFLAEFAQSAAGLLGSLLARAEQDPGIPALCRFLAAPAVPPGLLFRFLLLFAPGVAQGILAAFERCGGPGAFSAALFVEGVPSAADHVDTHAREFDDAVGTAQ